MNYHIIFFGSTADSVIVLDRLFHCQPSPVNCQLVAVVTQPAKPVGRDKTITPTPVEVWAKQHKITVISFSQLPDKPWLFADETEVTNTISSFKPDLLITACFGERIPKSTIDTAKFGGINIHPSLLPRWRGAYPVPWTIIAGDAQTGVTLSSIEEKFDDGKILAQKKVPLTSTDIADDMRTKLFTMGADLLVTTIPEFFKGSIKGIPQKKEDVTVARRITKQDGYIPWDCIDHALQGIDTPREQRSGLLSTVNCELSSAIFRMYRAFSPWPGIWTTIPIQGQDKRVKILTCIVREEKLELQTVQLEGKNPVDWKTFSAAYLAS